MKKHYETHVEDTDKLISVAGPILEYKSWYEQYRKLMEEQAQRKYGLYTPTSEGDDDFPSIPGMIARYSALGLTNEQMAANPVWVDKTGNGHDLQLKNFAWGGMSGVGGYNQNFNQWGYGNLPPALQTYTPHKMELNIPSTLRTGNVYSNLGKEGDIYDFTLNIVGLKDGASLDITKGVVSGNIERIKKDGIYKIYQPLETSWDQLRIYIVIHNPNLVDLNITIEQLPIYPGALVFDGVDDYSTCNNFPILTKEKGYTVVALRQWITRGEIASGLVSNVKDWFNDGAFLLEYRNVNANYFNSPMSFGTIGSEKDLPHILTYQTSKSYNGVSIITGNFTGTDVLYVGKLATRNVGICINAAIWELVFLDHDATEEELTKIKDYFVKTYPWLFFDQAWTVTGKTNEDADRATITNITGNGKDLVLSNFGFAEGSGYNEEGEYAGYLVTDGVDDKVQSSSFTMNEDWTIVGDWELLSNVQINCGIVKAQNVYLYSTANGLLISINNPRGLQSFGTKSLHAICSDGRLYDRNWVEYKYTADQNFSIVKSSLNIGFNLNNYTQMAFKNLGIYNNQLLSKDDCIKAYNYLQTLKSK